MTSWSIHTDGVISVLTNVQTASEELGVAFLGVNTAQTELESGIGDLLGPASAAVIGLVSSEEARFTGVANRIQACALGAAQATSAYVQGDEEMAARTQSAAVQAASSGDLSFFEGPR